VLAGSGVANVFAKSEHAGHATHQTKAAAHCESGDLALDGAPLIGPESSDAVTAVSEDIGFAESDSTAPDTSKQDCCASDCQCPHAAGTQAAVLPAFVANQLPPLDFSVEFPPPLPHVSQHAADLLRPPI
jgi:hypothetical protein